MTPEQLQHNITKALLVAAEAELSTLREDRDKWKSAYDGSQWHLGNAVHNVESEVSRNATLRDEIKRLRDALEPFAKCFDDRTMDGNEIVIRIANPLKLCREARYLLRDLALAPADKPAAVTTEERYDTQIAR